MLYFEIGCVYVTVVKVYELARVLHEWERYSMRALMSFIHIPVCLVYD